jgi:putative transposase
VVQTLTFQTLNVFFLISHDRRRLLHFDVTSHPTAAWVWRQMIEATLWGQHPRYLIHDRDRVYGADFATRAAGVGIGSIRTPIRSPRANLSPLQVEGAGRSRGLPPTYTYTRRAKALGP